MKSFLTFLQIHRSIKQRATRFSLLVVILLFGLFLEAYMHDFNLVYIALFFVFALAFTAAFLSVINIGYLKAHFVEKVRLFAKHEGNIILEVENPSTTTVWAVSVGNETAKVPLGSLKSKSKKRIQLPYLSEKRGDIYLDDYNFDSKYPLSTAHLFMPVKSFFKGVVYPEPKGISLESYISQKEDYYGEAKEFDGLQSYDGSQKLSHIHWASVAKGEMAVKIFSKERQVPELLFDFKKIAKDDESRLSQLCLWVLTCEKQQLHFSIKMPKRLLDVKKESIDEILSYLAHY